MNVSATVVGACTVATTPLSFGNLSILIPFVGTAIITVNCASGVPYRIDIDAGLNYSTNGSSRKMTDVTTATAFLSYSLFKDAPQTIEWGDNGNTYCAACATIPTGKIGTGTGAGVVHTVYGLPWGFNGTVLDTYNDTVTVR